MHLSEYYYLPMNPLLEWIDTKHVQRVIQPTQITPSLYLSVSIQQKGPLKWYIDPACSAPSIVPNSISSHLVAFCVQLALLLHCLDGPGEMGYWDDEEAGAMSVCVPWFDGLRRRLTCSSRRQYQPKRCTKPRMPRAARRSRPP